MIEMSYRLSATLPWILCATLSTGCGASRLPSTVALEPPPVLICADDPKPPEDPDGPKAGEYILRVWAAGDDCRRKLDAVR